jgi:Fe-S-cluster containining protein
MTQIEEERVCELLAPEDAARIRESASTGRLRGRAFLSALSVELNRAVEAGRDPRCAALDLETKRCRVYDRRPLICRLFGMVKAMRCPHGCRPVAWVPHRAASRYLQELDQMQLR